MRTDEEILARIKEVEKRDMLVHLGRGIWMGWHNYFGPTFYCDRDCTKLIEDWWEKPRVLEAFNKWRRENPLK